MLDRVLDEREIDYILKRVMVRREDIESESQIVGLAHDVCKHIRGNYLMEDRDYQDLFDNVLLYMLSNRPSEVMELEDKFTRSDLELWIKGMWKSFNKLLKGDENYVSV